MNVLYLTGHVGDADLVVHELGTIAPHIHVQIFPLTGQALELVALPGRFDAVLLDPQARGDESESLIARIREQEQAPAVVVMTGPADEVPPLKMLEAGADDYIVKRPHFFTSLPSLLQDAIERRRAASLRLARPLKVLFAGDAESARLILSPASNIELEAATIGSDGSIQLASTESGELPYDAAILDSSGFGAHILEMLKELQAVAPHIPAILLIDAGLGTLAAQGLKLGADGCVGKGDDCVHCLVTTLENAIRRKELGREKAVLAAQAAAAGIAEAKRARREEEAIARQKGWEAERGKYEADIMRLRDEVGAAAANLTQAEERYRAEKAEWQASREEMERQRLALEEALRTAEVERRQLEELDRRERGEAERTNRELEQQRREDVSRRESLEENVRDLLGRQAEMDEQYRAARAEWDGSRLQLERQHAEALGRLAETENARASLEEAFRALEASCARLEEKHQAERDEWEASWREVERQRQEQQERIGALEADLAAAEGRAVLLQTQLESEQADAGAAREQLSRRLELIEEEMHGLQARHGEVMAQIQVERANWEAAQQELTRLRDAAEAQRAALEADQRALQAQLAELEEQRTTEKLAWDKERRDLQRQPGELAARNELFEKALAGTESDLAQLTEEQRLERQRREKLHEELRQQRAARVALEGTLRASENRKAVLVDAQRIEQAERRAMNEELGRQRVSRQTLEDALRAEEERLAQLSEAHRAAQAELDALREELEMQRAVRLALEEALRAAEARQRAELFTDLAAEALQVFTRLVGPVRDCGRLLMESLGADDPRRARAARLMEVAGHADRLARRMLSLEARREPLDLNLAVREMEESLRSLAGEKVELITILAPSLPRIFIDRPQAEELLSSLVTCARDSLPAGGTVVVESAQTAPDTTLLTRPPVLLAVTASGNGVLPPERISPLEALVAQCGGQLNITGDADLGATIEVSLPAET